MVKLVADVNCVGIVRQLLRVLGREPWLELWDGLGVRLVDFAALGLAHDTTDDVVWRTCQAAEVVLVTVNRNQDAPNSLEAVIRNENSPRSLPVFTLADPDRIQEDRDYAERAAEQLLEYLYDLEKIRGAGRMYIP